MNQPDETNLLDEPDLTGEEVGDYIIISRLGRGGMADVYLSEQKSLKRKVALKVLHKSLAQDPAYVSRFKNEAQAAAALTHPNIVRIYEVGSTDQFHYISQEYVEGQNLKQYLQQHGSASPFLVAMTIRQVAAALHKARELGVIHRDIKPENIMISEGEVKVADFGLARIKKNEGSQNLTKVGMTMGTPLYMSPEQAEGGVVDHRSDIYSLGVTAYHMLAGRPPFEKENAIATAVAHKTEQPVALSQIREDLPAELIGIVNRMMEKEPGDRYQDCGGIIKDLLTVKLDESQEEWSPKFKTLSPAETSALYSSHLEATRKLDAAIHGKQLVSKNIWIASGLVLATLLAFGVGSMIAGFNPPDPLLPPVSEDDNPIPKKSNVFDQLNYARQIPNADYEKKLNALMAVKAFFPLEGDNLYSKRSNHLWADFYIGLLHYNQQYYDLAEDEFMKLTKLSHDEYMIFKLHGQAGLVFVLDKRKELEGSDVKQLSDKIESNRADIISEIDRFEPELREKLESIFVKSEDANGDSL